MCDMHPLQEKLLRLASQYNLGRMSYREIGKLIGESHPQKIKYHLEQLERNQLVHSNPEGTAIRKTGLDKGIVSIPILGSADCGPATMYADENIEGYLRISSKLIPAKPCFFALKAVGNSMNKANIDGQTLENGDYAIIDASQKTPRNNEYVVSIIDGVCNIKKFIKDNKNEQIILVSESTQEFPPIYIHPEDVSYLVSGKIIRVVKKPIL